MSDKMNGRSPYFSVILPIYRVEEYLEQCIRSVLDQDFTDYELILVDDGSPDRCPEICDHYAERYDHIRVVHKENGGLSSARNAGTEAARGTYIWWVDSDDWIAPGSLRALHEATVSDQPDMVKFDYCRVAEETTLCRSNARAGCYDDPGEIGQLVDQAFFAPGKFVLSAWSHVYRRAFLTEQALTFVSERRIGSEDYLFNLQALASARSIRMLDAPLYHYRLRAGSLTQRYRKDLLEQYTRLYRHLMEYFDRKGLAGHGGKICRFYVWHMIHGTCIANAYRVPEGRKKLAAFLRTREFRDAAKRCDRTGLSAKQRLQLLAMELGLEPLFYWLYVVKPKRGKKVAHET